MANRYWVGGTGTWNTTSTTNWSDTSGGSGGFSVPTADDNVFFDQAATYTVTMTGSITCLDFTVSSGPVTFTGSASPTLSVKGSYLLSVGTIWTSNASLVFIATTTGKTITTNGVSVQAASFLFNGIGASWTLGSALTTTAGINLSNGSFYTAGFAVTALSFSSNNSNTRTLNLGASTVTLSSTTTVWNTPTSTGFTFVAGTSTINCTGFLLNGQFFGGNLTYNNVSFTGGGQTSSSITGANTFNNLTIAGRTPPGNNIVSFSSNQTINGTLTLSAGTTAAMRTSVQSNIISTPRILTCAAVASLVDIDFRDITIAGAAAPVSGTRLGDCKGNSGITFPGAKTVYWASNSGAQWYDSSTPRWSNTIGGSTNNIYFPLAQDTAVITSSQPVSGATITISAAYNIGTIDMSARTSNTMTLATGVQAGAIYGNWINGTGITLTGTGTLTFAGRGNQTITSAGKTFTPNIICANPSGSVTLQDALVVSGTSSQSLRLDSGTLDFNGYNVTQTGTVTAFNSSNSNTRTLALGSGTFTIAGSGGFNCSTSTGLTVTGTGTISLTSASAKAFSGGGIQTWPTLNQGSASGLTITGSNKFANITNTAFGAVLFTQNTTNEFTDFSLSGIAGTPLAIRSTVNGTPAYLKKSSTWYMGANSTNGAGNTGLTFTAGGGIDYLTVSYITGLGPAPSGLTNIYYGSDNTLQLYLGSTPVTSVYYGSTKVWG